MGWLDGYKRRLYLVMFLSGALSSSFAWALNEYSGNTSAFTRTVFGTVVISTSVFAAITYLRPSAVRFVQEALYVVIGGVLFSVLAYSLYADLTDRLQVVSLFSMFLFMPFLYIFVFLAYDEPGALVRSGIILAATVGISLPALIDERFHSLIVAPNTILLSYLAAVLIIVQLYMLAKMKESLKSAEHLTRVDPLTSLLNRRGFEEVLDGRIEAALQHNTALSMVVFDLDNFKTLNDTLGHDAGDEALVSVARTVETGLRETDAFARWGGEEFAVLCPDTSSDEAYLFAERLRSQVEKLDVTASFGVSTLALGTDKDDLTKQADLALYAAKESGKNRTEIYGEKADEELEKPL
ncbi:GGDEF domain-containing protein [Rubrobacter indicoceani]|uniref:GGDEF domain-containing protein n=1 Tax=Rubrobacter indicoceani TaxID=2051957 RepID=UPI000E5BD80D|nr:GGDEF domain-containing protein [Rubrobacter indicoceani]